MSALGVKASHEAAARLAKPKRATGGRAGFAGGGTPSNAFDQFDSASSGNAFDQFDAGAAKPPVSTMMDVAKSAGVGVGKGMIGLAGLPADAASLLNRGIDYGESLLSPTGSQPSAATDPKFGSADLQRRVEGVTGKFYEPQTTLGKYAQTIGEFAPAVVGGPEGLASRALTRAVVPGVASEAAGEATEGTAAEPWARAAGALAGGVGASKAAEGLAGVAASRKVASAIPTTDELYTAADTNYTNARGYGVELHRQPVANLASQIWSDLYNDGFRPRNVPKTFDALNELYTPGSPTVDISDMESIRRALRQAGANPVEASERGASTRAISAIDDYLANLHPRDVAVNPQFAGRVSSELSDARGNYAAAKRSELIETGLERADLQAASTGSGANLDNATRQKVRQILTNPRASRGFSQDELQQMQNIVRGTFTGNAARWLGKLAPTGAVSAGMLADLVSGLPGPFTGAAVTGYAAKKVGDALTTRGVTQLSNQVRARSPLATQRAASNQPVLPPPRQGLGALPAVAAGNAGIGMLAPFNLNPLRQLQGPVPAGANQNQNQ